MKIRWLIPLIVLIAILLSACQFGKPAPLPDQDAPLSGQEYPYPGLDVEIPTPPAVLYPDINDGDETNWYWIEAMMWNSEVVKIVQAPEKKVYVTLKDGRTLISLQPEADYVLIAIERCGDICRDILVETE